MKTSKIALLMAQHEEWMATLDDDTLLDTLCEEVVDVEDAELARVLLRAIKRYDLERVSDEELTSRVSHMLRVAGVATLDDIEAVRELAAQAQRTARQRQPRRRRLSA